jgi:hypothetical protein
MRACELAQLRKEGIEVTLSTAWGINQLRNAAADFTKARLNFLLRNVAAAWYISGGACARVCAGQLPAVRVDLLVPASASKREPLSFRRQQPAELSRK